MPVGNSDRAAAGSLQDDPSVVGIRSVDCRPTAAADHQAADRQGGQEFPVHDQILRARTARNGLVMSKRP